MKDRKNLLSILHEEGYENAHIMLKKDNTMEVFLDETSGDFPLLPDYIIHKKDYDRVLNDKFPLNALATYDITDRYIVSDIKDFTKNGWVKSSTIGSDYDIEKSEHTKTDILKEAIELLNGDRAKDYGDLVDNFENIQTIANIMLKKDKIALKLEHIAIVMIAVKISREGNKHKRDNLVDAVNYIQIYNTLKNSQVNI